METLTSPAKLNLRLKITGRRSDTGYHTLSMLNVTASLVDEIQIHALNSNVPSVRDVNFGETVPLSQRAELEKVLRSNSNSAIKAAELFGKKFNVTSGVEFSITKRIPAGAGLGGGSSNAASILIYLLKKHLNVLLPVYGDNLTEEVISLASSIGADIPYSLCGGAAIVRGIGEIIEPLPPVVQSALHEMDVIIALPNEHSSTKKAYEDFSKSNSWLESETRTDEKIEIIKSSRSENEVFENLTTLVDNDFERVVADKVKAVADVLKLTKDLKLGRVVLSGSGSSVLILPLPDHKFSQDQKITIKKALFSASINHFDGCIHLY